MVVVKSMALTIIKNPPYFDSPIFNGQPSESEPEVLSSWMRSSWIIDEKPSRGICWSQKPWKPSCYSPRAMEEARGNTPSHRHDGPANCILYANEQCVISWTCADNWSSTGMQENIPEQLSNPSNSQDSNKLTIPSPSIPNQSSRMLKSASNILRLAINTYQYKD